MKTLTLSEIASAAWVAIRKAHADAVGYIAGPSEAQQLGFTAL